MDVFHLVQIQPTQHEVSFEEKRCRDELTTNFDLCAFLCAPVSDEELASDHHICDVLREGLKEL